MKLMKETIITQIPFKELYEKIGVLYTQYCSITEKTPAKRKEKWEKKSKQLWEERECEVVTVLQRQLSLEEAFLQGMLTKEWFTSHIEETFDKVDIYFICLTKEPEEKKNVLENYYQETLSSAAIMAAMYVTEEKLKAEYRCSVSFVAGLDEIPIENLSKWLDYVDSGHEYGTVDAAGSMKPENSLLGIHFLA